MLIGVTFKQEQGQEADQANPRGKLERCDRFDRTFHGTLRSD
jgi:hypothetical protein